jgi:signal transduction histidine kinase
MSRWRALRWTLGRHGELVLAGTLVAMVAYEAAEIWLLEDRQTRSLSVAISFHGLQIVAVVIATTLAVRAWRRKTALERQLAAEVERAVTAQEDERRRIAYELHDSISPLIVSAKQHVDTCRDLFGGSPSGRADQQLETAAERLDRAIVEMRRVLKGLRPAALAGDSLEAAARRSVDDAASESGWQATFTSGLGDEPLPPAVEAAAYRILQEALTNAGKHARTERVEVALRREGGWLLLDVRDHGVGLERGSTAGSDGLGLVSMKERARLVGGTCRIQRDAGRGILVRARLPVPPSIRSAT